MQPFLVLKIVLLLTVSVKLCVTTESLEQASSSQGNNIAVVQLDETLTAKNQADKDVQASTSPTSSEQPTSVTTQAADAPSTTFQTEVKEKRQTNNPSAVTGEPEQALPICTHAPSRRTSRHFEDEEELLEMLQQKRPRSAGGSRWGGGPSNMGMFSMSMNPMDLGMGMGSMDMNMGLNPIVARQAGMNGQMGMNPMMGSMGMNPMSGMMPGMMPGGMMVQPGMNSMGMMGHGGMGGGDMGPMSMGGLAATADVSGMNGMMGSPVSPVSPMAMGPNDMNQNFGFHGMDGSAMGGMGMNGMMGQMNNPMAQQQSMMGMAGGGNMNPMQMPGMGQQPMMNGMGMQPNPAAHPHPMGSGGPNMQQNQAFMQGNQQNAVRIARNGPEELKTTPPTTTTTTPKATSIGGMEKSTDMFPAAGGDSKHHTGKKDLDRMFKIMSSVMEKVLNGAAANNKAKDDTEATPVQTVVVPVTPIIIDMLATQTATPPGFGKNAVIQQQGTQVALLQTPQNPPQGQSPAVLQVQLQTQPSMDQSSMQSHPIMVSPPGSLPSASTFLSPLSSSIGQIQQQQMMVNKPMPQTLLPLAVPTTMLAPGSPMGLLFKPQQRVNRQLMSPGRDKSHGHEEDQSSCPVQGPQASSMRHFSVAAATRILRKRRPSAAVAGLEQELIRLAHKRRDSSPPGKGYWPQGGPPDSDEVLSSVPCKFSGCHRRSPSTLNYHPSRHSGKQTRLSSLVSQHDDEPSNLNAKEAGQVVPTSTAATSTTTSSASGQSKKEKDSLAKKAIKFFVGLFSKRTSTEAPTTLDSITTDAEKMTGTSSTGSGVSTPLASSTGNASETKSNSPISTTPMKATATTGVVKPSS